MNFKCVWAKEILYNVYLCQWYNIWKRSKQLKPVQTLALRRIIFQLVQYILIDMRIEHCPEPADICNKYLRKCQQQVTSYLVDLFRLYCPTHSECDWNNYIGDDEQQRISEVRSLAPRWKITRPIAHMMMIIIFLPDLLHVNRALNISISIQKTSDVNMSEYFYGVCSYNKLASFQLFFLF